jgi:hypothetical protein
MMKTANIWTCLGSAVGTFILVFAVTAPSFAQSPPLKVPFVDEWAASPHARIWEESFAHWNKDGVIPAVCAKCHSTRSLHDFLGLDGSPAGKVDKAALVGEGVTCVACHNKAIGKLAAVKFPSGISIERDAPDARCMLCHQGRQSTPQVNKTLAKVGAAADAVSPKLKFLNVHDRAAAATRFGTEAKGGYEYAGKKYAGLYVHDEKSTLCTDCHDNHTLQVTVGACVECHKGIKKRKDYVKVRTTKKDYDGDGNIKEGIAAEIKIQHQRLYGAIKAYAKQVSGKPLVYESHKYPYFFTDKNGDGKAGKGEAIFPNRYKNWTPRLLKAAYNYQFVAKDPGAYTHNPFYALQLLHDSLEDLSKKIKIDMAGAKRP